MKTLVINTGPTSTKLAFDNAISEKAAAIKGMSSPVSGQADVPIIINSRADNSETKLCSIAVAVLIGSEGE